MSTKKKKPLCPQCGSSQIVTRRVKTPKRYCRACGAEFDHCSWKEV